jgi:hypothetical protein
MWIWKRKQEKQPKTCPELADKVAYLFDTYRKLPTSTSEEKTESGKYSFAEVEELTNGAITETELANLSRGIRVKSHSQALKKLASFFKIDPQFWAFDLDEWQEWEESKKRKDKV